MKTFQEKLKKNEDEEAKLKKDIIFVLLHLPENPNIEVLSNNPKCFIIKSSDLKDNLSVDFHSFSSQEMLVHNIRESKIRTSTIIENVIREGKINYRGVTYLFHSELIQLIKEMYYGKDKI